MEGPNALDSARRGNLLEQLDDCRMNNRWSRWALRVDGNAAAVARIEADSLSREFIATGKAQHRAETRVTELNSDLPRIGFSGDGCRMPAGTLLPLAGAHPSGSEPPLSGFAMLVTAQPTLPRPIDRRLSAAGSGGGSGSSPADCD